VTGNRANGFQATQIDTATTLSRHTAAILKQRPLVRFCRWLVLACVSVSPILSKAKDLPAEDGGWLPEMGGLM
jgi:hypothetical protein